MVREAFDLAIAQISSPSDLVPIENDHFFYRILQFISPGANLPIILLLLGALILILALLKGLFMFFMRQTIIVMSRFIEYDLKTEVYDHY